MNGPASLPGTHDAVLAIDVGGTLVKTAIVGPHGVRVERQATATVNQPWSLDRLVGIAQSLHATAIGEGAHPAALAIAVPGQVDDFHGVVQYSANLPWHDVAVADTLSSVVPCDVLVRHDVRAAALAEASLGAGADVTGLLFVAVGTGIAAAGVHGGMVVADHAGAGEIGQIRIRSGPGEGSRLERFASAKSIAARYCTAVGLEPGSVTSKDVHARLAADTQARKVWDEAVDALADALEWSITLFNPERLVVGGGLVNAGADLLDPLTAGLTRRMLGRNIPAVHAAAFGDDAGWVGAALIAWKAYGWSVDSLTPIVGVRRQVTPEPQA